MPGPATPLARDEILASIEARDWPRAEALLTRRIAEGGPAADDLWQLAGVQRRQLRLEAVVDTCTRFLAVAGDDPRVEEAHAERLRCAHKLGRFDQAERYARAAAMTFPARAYFPTVIGETLLMRNCRPQAEAWLERALRLDPSATEARAMLQALRAGGEAGEAPPPVKTVGWPSKLARLGDIREVIRKSVLRGYGEQRGFIGPETAFLTLGSCFAHSLAVRLKAAGYRADSEFLTEEVNSTFANRYLLEWIEKGAVDAQTKAMEAAYGPELRKRFRESFMACDVFIFTLGLAPCYFSRSTGEFFFMSARSQTATDFLRSNFEMRSTSVQENRANISAILATVRRLTRPGVRIVLSVSPVPLGATSEFASPVIADCISKSTLRIACHEALGEPAASGVVYWPSFEMVRWLGAHFGRDFEPAFGQDDGNSRHVSRWLVGVIIDLFLETFSRDRAVGAGAAQGG